MSEARRRALGAALDGRLDPTRMLTRHRIHRTGPFEEVPLVWSGAWNLADVGRDRQARYISDLMGARGDPSRSESFRDQLAGVSRGELGQVGFVVLESEADIRWHFACYHRIAVSIATHGILAREDSAVTELPPGRHPERLPANPTASIGPDGRPHWSGDGRHRTAIAHWLGLRSVPVTVRSVDRGWLAAADADLRAAVASWFADRPAAADDGATSREWLESLASLDPAPDLALRPDPDGTNDLVEVALRAHRIGQWEEAWAAWTAAGARPDGRPGVAVLAGRTAMAAGELATAAELVAGVLAQHPGHLAASELVATIESQRAAAR